jgi:HAD superfamily hydrolase (TIGR01509 family)
MVLRALIFDVDGTLAETEEIHRDAFNRAFAEDGLPWHWDVDLYRDLLKVTGGKERIRRWLEMDGVSPTLDDARIARLHVRKNEIYGETVRSGGCVLRPGVAEVIAAARARGLQLAIATTTSRPNVEALLAALFTEEPDLFDPIVAGEDVAAKKPAPDAYVLAVEKLGLSPADCLALEDSRNGLTAARAAGIPTVVTPSLYTAHETFEGAAKVMPDLTELDLTAW